ncbi:hypothetical protein IPM62_02220 [Candidatus Woesebacteria bacterium]|nr:MAG: hypothetical protein IPM62_02220 [Candidatus Woesebacteria bacterium]
MENDRLPKYLLEGRDSFNCQPCKNGPLVTVTIAPNYDREGTPIEYFLGCPLRKPKSMCHARRNDRYVKNRRCCYWKGDGLDYQIIGPGMDRKLPDDKEWV